MERQLRPPCFSAKGEQTTCWFERYSDQLGERILRLGVLEGICFLVGILHGLALRLESRNCPKPTPPYWSFSH